MMYPYIASCILNVHDRKHGYRNSPPRYRRTTDRDKQPFFERLGWFRKEASPLAERSDRPPLPPAKRIDPTPTSLRVTELLHDWQVMAEDIAKTHFADREEYERQRAADLAELLCVDDEEEESEDEE